MNLSKNRSWFTILDMIILSGIVLTIIMGTAAVASDAIGSGYVYFRSNQLSAETSTAMFMLDRLILGAYGVDYSKTGWDGTNDRLTLITDKQEKTKISIFIRKDASKDISQLCYQYDDADPIPIMSASSYVTKFRIITTADPRSSPARIDDQPFVTYEIETRSRSPMKKQTSDALLDQFGTKTLRKTGTSIVGNFVPSSLKN